MPVGEREDKTYLQTSFGKFRIKCDENDPRAKKRVNSQDVTVYELVYNWVQGHITGLFYKTSEEYGNSYDVTIDDGDTKYSVSLKENSRYCQDFLSKLPNVDFSKWVKLVPYDFKPEGADKNRQGLNLYQDIDGKEEKMENFFVKKDGEEYIYMHKFPPSDGKMDDDEFQIYIIKVKKFLREYTNSNIIPKIQKSFMNNASEAVSGQVAESPQVDNDDDLPF